MRRLRSELDTFELIRLLPPAGVMAVWAVLMVDSGGFRPGTWMPAGLALAGLLVVSAVGNRRMLPVAGPTRWALLVLIAFTVWCFLSIIWSDAPGAAWEASNLLLIGVLGAWTLALAPWRPRTAEILMVGFSVAAAAVCLAALISALAAADLTSRFEDLRFSPPLDYPNTTAAFAFMAAIPPIVLSSRPDVGIIAKALAQGLATFLCAYALLPQSRGSILGLVATVPLLVLIMPVGWRLTLHAGLTALLVLAAAGPISHVYTAAAETGRASAALGDATRAILLVAAAAVAAGLAVAAATSRVRLGPAGQRRSRLAGIAVTAIAVAAAAGFALSHSTAISDTLQDQWRSLSHPGVEFAGRPANKDSGRLASIDPLERYDYWRVSAGGFRAAPIGGIGAGGFEHRYTEERRYPKFARYPHNVVLKVLGETGIVGVLLIGAFVLVVGGGLLWSARRLPIGERAVAATALAMLVYFVAHGLFDWLEAYPVLVGPVLAFPLVALAVCGRAQRLEGLGTSTAAVSLAPSAPAKPRRGSSRVAWTAGVVAALLAAGSLLAPWLSLRYRQRASASWRTHPELAYRDLRRAADLNPLSPAPLELQGVIGLVRGDFGPARAGFEGALDREQDWLSHFALGTLAAERGDRAGAAREFALARRLNRLDPVLREVTAKALSGGKVDPAALLREVLVSPFFEVERIT